MPAVQRMGEPEEEPKMHSVDPIIMHSVDTAIWWSATPWATSLSTRSDSTEPIKVTPSSWLKSSLQDNFVREPVQAKPEVSEDLSQLRLTKTEVWRWLAGGAAAEGQRKQSPAKQHRASRQPGSEFIVASVQRGALQAKKQPDSRARKESDDRAKKQPDGQAKKQPDDQAKKQFDGQAKRQFDGQASASRQVGSELIVAAGEGADRPDAGGGAQRAKAQSADEHAGRRLGSEFLSGSAGDASPDSGAEWRDAGAEWRDVGASARRRPDGRGAGRQRLCSDFIFDPALQEVEGFMLVPFVIGHGGANTRRIWQECSSKARVRGRGSGHPGRDGREEDVSLRLSVSSKTSEEFQRAREIVARILKRVGREAVSRLRRLQPATTIPQKFTVIEQKIISDPSGEVLVERIEHFI